MPSGVRYTHQQDDAYRIIAGDDSKYQVFRTGKAQREDEHVCDCKDKKSREAVRALAPKPEELTDRQRQLMRDLATGAKAGAAAAGIMATAMMAARAAALLAALAF